jgi:hypothetical protein
MNNPGNDENITLTVRDWWWEFAVAALHVPN